MQMQSKMNIVAPIAAVLVVLAVGAVAADTNSYFDKQYEFTTLKTWDFKTQRRISSDPIANNKLWANDIQTAIASDMAKNGFERVNAGARPDFLVAYYVGLKERYNVQYMDYGAPGFWGPRRFRWGWGWPNDVDVWRIPYTSSTLIVDIIDGQTNQLIWRGYDTGTIDMKKPNKQLDQAVQSLVKKFIKDTRES